MKTYGPRPHSNHKLKFAAIDVGTNAARLLLSHVYFDGARPIFKKIGLYRIPLQLGDDVFSTNLISDKKAEKLRHTMAAFSHLIKVFNPIETIACATSAIREANNGSAICESIRETTGINLQIINGKQESELIVQNQLAHLMKPDHQYLYIDVGGGSTEISYFVPGIPTQSRSFKIGTLRLLNNWVEPSEWQAALTFVESLVDRTHPIVGIGTGGNISKALSLCGGKDPQKPVTRKKLLKLQAALSTASIRDRILVWGLKPDRAEVIVPALDVYISCMNWGTINTTLMPKVGLSDGLIQLLFRQHIAAHPIPFESGFE